jgi:hypothetical protein
MNNNNLAKGLAIPFHELGSEAVPCHENVWLFK